MELGIGILIGLGIIALGLVIANIFLFFRRMGQDTEYTATMVQQIVGEEGEDNE